MALWNIHDIPIQRKLILVILFTSLTALLLASAAFFANDIFSFKDAKARDFQTISQILGSNCTAALSFDDHKAAEEVLQTVSLKPHVVSAGIYDKNGAVFAGYSRENETLALPPAPGPDGHRFERSRLIVVSPIFLNNQRVGTIYLEADLKEIDERFRHYAGITFLVLLSSFLLAFVISSVFQKVIARPVLALSEVAKTVSAKKDYSIRAQKYGRDELGKLTDTFNQMLAEIQQQNELLKKSHEERFRSLSESASEAIISSDSAGSITYSNKGCERMFGYSPAEALGRPLTLLMPEHFKEAHLKGFRRYLSTGEARVIGKTIELTGKRKDGAEFPIEISISTWKESGAVFFTAIIRDITARKHAQEKQAVLIAEIEVANRELNDFAYVVSHDLKAPLRGITSLTSWLLTDYSDKLDAAGRDQLNLLSGRVKRMHNLIDGILRYSRVGRTAEEKSRIDLNELVSEVADAIDVPPNIEIRIENPLPVISAERTQIEQLFQNFLSNAIRYIDKPKGLIRVSCALKDGFWNFRITDNGPGIDEKYFEKIFKIFQTLTSRDESESTGIGLAIVKKIIERAGGTVGVESRLGEGSTFFFTLPKT